MPRPVSPPLLSPITMMPFIIPDSRKPDLSKVLGLSSLSSEISDMIAHAIASFKATKDGSPDTTIGNIIAALDELMNGGTVYQKAVERLADERCGVDYTTHGNLQGLAKAVLDNQIGARDALMHATKARIAELKNHKRIKTTTESFRFFCAVLRLIFNDASSPELRKTESEGWRNCIRFAIEVFSIADIEHDFEAHPERLKALLGTNV